MKKATPEEVNWWQSKKFVSWMIGEFTWKSIIVACLFIVTYYQGGNLSAGWLTLIVTMVIVAGFVQVGFIGGQAWLDRYTRMVAPVVKKLSPGLGDTKEEVEDETEG